MCSVFHLLPFQETCREPSASGRVEVVTQLAQQTGIRSTWAVYSWHQTKIVKGPGKNSVYSREVKWCLFQGWQLVKGQPEGGHHCAEGGQWTSFQTCPMNGPNQRIEQGFYYCRLCTSGYTVSHWCPGTSRMRPSPTEWLHLQATPALRWHRGKEEGKFETFKRRGTVVPWYP